jgi:phosphoribosylformylglycinamidine synthase
MPVSKETLDEIALTQAEYEAICERLGREPNSVELGMFGALWSEHCGYKHTTPLFQYFPTTGPRIVVPIGEENAGVVDIGQGMAVVFKMESHNHPSAVEPFQGAATGVGGIVRDILAMGARPIALMNSLRFGPLSEPRNRYLFDGVVGGISWYGNCIGIPDVGGEVVFSPTYTHNPLVNALCVGLVEKERMLRAAAGGAGNVLLLVGADTGRDGRAILSWRRCSSRRAWRWRERLTWRDCRTWERRASPAPQWRLPSEAEGVSCWIWTRCIVVKKG